ncbi:MAG: hypothetical protein MUC34_12250 [Anaerolineae bacterium]|nr:hypothetical protein [Anaerolineae bacterium]
MIRRASPPRVAWAAFVLAMGLTALALAIALSATEQASAGNAAQAASPTATPETGQTGDPATDPTTATLKLQAGYIMDPYLIPVIGKTEIPASQVAQGCNGFVAREPSAVVNWSGTAPRLNFFVYGDGDAVLAVQKPDGSFVCNDDAGARTVDPLVSIANPAAGAYKIHAGAARDDEPALGFLAITQAEMDDERLAGLDLSPMLRRRARPRPVELAQLEPGSLFTERAAIFGSSELKTGFRPVEVFAAGGGEIAAVRVEDRKLTCAGFINAVPSYSFTWSGASQPLRLFFEGQKDTTLAVVLPGQEEGQRRIVCGMNSASDNLNPSVDIAAPAAGKYLVYVAPMEPNTVAAGRLTITGDLKDVPAGLPAAAQ